MEDWEKARAWLSHPKVVIPTAKVTQHRGIIVYSLTHGQVPSLAELTEEADLHNYLKVARVISHQFHPSTHRCPYKLDTP
jgi:hypothetical protein